MSDKNRYSYIQRADSILYGELRGDYDSLIDDRENRLAYAFLLLLKLNGLPIRHIDEAQLKASEDQISYLAQTQNVYAGYFNIEKNWNRNDLGDFIGFLAEDEKPVIIRKHAIHYSVYDPESGKEERYDPKRHRLSDMALNVLALPDKENISGPRLIFDAVLRQKAELAIFGGLTMLVALFSLLIPIAINRMVGQYIYWTDSDIIKTAAICLILIISMLFLINVTVNRSKAVIESKARARVMATVLTKLSQISSGDEEKIKDDLVGLFMPFVTALETIIDSALGTFVYLFQSIVIIISIGFSSKGSMKIIMYVVILVALVTVWIEYLIYTGTKKKQVTEKNLNLIKTELLDNVEAIKNYDIQNRLYYRFAVSYDENMRHVLSLNSASQWQSALLTITGSVVLLTLFANIEIGHDMQKGTVTAVTASLSLMISYLGMMLGNLSTFLKNIHYANLATQVMGFESEGIGAEGYTGEVSGEIELSNVSFRYSEDSGMIIKNVSLRIEPGEFIGIVGGSGSGKSTLIKLLLGFVKPTEGVVSYDGEEIDRFDMEALRSQFGVVMQNAQLVTGSIASNIGMSQDADMDKVMKAARMANIHDEIDAMPMKYNTMLSSEAELVSGGQRQRIVLARALMNDPRILILDEATSAMDNKSQAVVKQSLKGLNITRIVVAHRLSTIEDCDRIIVMDKGSVVEVGSYEELMEARGLFYRMACRNLC